MHDLLIYTRFWTEACISLTVGPVTYNFDCSQMETSNDPSNVLVFEINHFVVLCMFYDILAS